MKKVLALGLAAVMAVSMAGCGNGGAAGGSSENQPDVQTEAGSQFAGSAPSGEASQPGNQGGEDVTLRFMWWGSDTRHEATIAVIEQYEALHPNVKIEAEYGGYDGYFEKLTTQLSGGTAADIIQYNANSITDLLAIGDVFVDLNDYEEVLDTSGFDEGFLKSFSYHGEKMLALPSGVNGGIWLTNTALLDEAGIKPEDIKTWEDFIAAGKKLHEFNETYYLFNIDIDTLGKELLGSFMAQLTGKDLIDVDTYELNFTREELKKVLTLINDMYRNHVLEPAADSAPYALKINTNPKWINHELASCYAATSNVYSGYYDFQDTATAMDMPVFDGAKESGILYMPPQMIAIASTCKYPEVAADFLNYFYNNEEAINTLKDCRSIQPTEKGRQICEEKGYLDPVLVSAVEKAMETGTNHQNIYTPAEIVAILQDATEKIAYGQGDVESITDETMELLGDTLERLKK